MLLVSLFSLLSSFFSFSSFDVFESVFWTFEVSWLGRKIGVTSEGDRSNGDVCCGVPIEGVKDPACGNGETWMPGGIGEGNEDLTRLAGAFSLRNVV